MTLPAVGGSYNVHGTALNAHINAGHQSNGQHFGSKTNLDSESNAFTATSIYKAGSDGIVKATITVNYFVYGHTGSANPPTTLSGQAHNHTGGPTNMAAFEMHVSKDEYWEINITGGSTSITWMPIGTGSCVKQ